MPKIQITYDWPNVVIKSGQSAWMLIVVGWMVSFAWDWTTLTLFEVVLPSWSANVAWTMMLCAGVWMVALIPVVRKAKTPWAPGKPTVALITTGPFAIMRHPGDVGTLVFGFGVALERSSWLLAVCLVLWAVVIHYGCHRREEDFFASKFPDEWGAYAKRVKRYGLI